MTCRRLYWSLLSCRRDLLALLWATALVAALADVALPWLLREGIDSALGATAGWSLGLVAALMLAVAAVITVSHWLGIYLETLLFSEAIFRLRRRLYGHLFRQGRSFFERHRTGELVQRVGNDIQVLAMGMIELFSEMPFSLMMGLGVLAMMAVTDLRLTVVVLVFLAVATWLTEYTGRRMPSVRRLIQLRCGLLASRLQESVAGMRTVQVFGAEEQEIGRLDTLNGRIRASEKYQGMQVSLTAPLWGFADVASLVAVLWYAGSLVAAREISVGTFVAFVAYMELLAAPMSKIGVYFCTHQTCKGITQRIASLLDDHDTIASGTEEGPPSARRLAIEHVSFAYSTTQYPVLHDISLNIEPGQCLAIVGRNGAGKTTLLDLLLRFQAPQKGRIAAGGLDLSRWRLASWRRRVGLVPQEPVLFHGTVAENVAFGLDRVDYEAVHRALIQAGGTRFLQELPDGVMTYVGERGAALSGGQRQIIALARVFLRDPQIVLLDEPTANLDGSALLHVGTALKEFMTGRTTVIVSHRPETIRLASRIVVLDRGRIVAEGTHDQLWQHENYRKLLGSEEPAEKAAAVRSLPASAAFGTTDKDIQCLPMRLP